MNLELQWLARSCLACSCKQVRNFQAAISMFGRVAQIAEAEGHHPDLHLTGYNNVAIELTTHAAGKRTSLLLAVTRLPQIHATTQRVSGSTHVCCEAV